MGVDLEKQALLAQNDAEKVPRTWRRHWGHIFGDCEGHDVAACFLSFKAPWVALSWNAQRALGLSFWKELVKFLLVTVGVWGLLQGIVCVTMMATCPPPPLPEDGNMMNMNQGGMQGGMMGGPHGGPHGGFHGEHPEHPELTDECMARVAPVFVLVVAVALTALGTFVYMAAKRRQMIRERYGIEGTFKNDVLLWTCCGPCALAQETRTLMHENVHGGLWHGPLPAAPVAMPPALGVPAQQQIV